MSWSRLKTVVRGVQAAIESEPKTLAPLRPQVADALDILSKPASDEAIDDLKFLLKRIQDFVVRWRPSPVPTPGVFYVQPTWARSTDEQAGEALAILQALPPLVKTGVEPAPHTTKTTSSSMRIFVSHSSADKAVAAAFVEMLRSAFTLPPKEIRCTSVEGYKLSAGADSNEQLRSEVFGCEVFVALLSPASMNSIYVMFELGARWGAKLHLAPVMVCGTKPSDLKAPLSGIHAVSGASEEDLHQFLSDIGEKLAIKVEGVAIYNKALRDFMKKARQGAA